MEQAFVTLNNKAYLILYIILYRFLILNYKFTVYGTIGAIYKKLLRNLACFFNTKYNDLLWMEHG